MSSATQPFTAASGADTQGADTTSESAAPVPLVKPRAEEQIHAPSSHSSYREVPVKDEFMPIASRGTFSTKTGVQPSSQSESAKCLTGPQGQLYQLSKDSNEMYELSRSLSKVELEKSEKEVRLERVESDNQDMLKEQIKEKDAEIIALKARIKALEERIDGFLLQMKKNQSKDVDSKYTWFLAKYVFPCMYTIGVNSVKRL